MPVANKHLNPERIFYQAFDGGLNLSAPAESINRNELRESVNVEFSMVTGSLRTRGGLIWSGDFSSKVLDVAEIPSSRGFLVKCENEIKYFTHNAMYTVDGKFSGTGPICTAQWGEKGEAVVASGGKLQLFKQYGGGGGPKLTTLSESPDKCRMCFVRGGRVGVVDDTDTIRFSHVGDCELWDNDPDDESTGQFIEIGYKDGTDITAVVPLSQDLVIFKAPKDDVTKGTVWRLKGDFPEWYPIESAHNTGTFSQRSVQAVGNDVFYLNPLGLAMLSSVEAYSEIKTLWPDRKVADALTQSMYDTAKLWNVPVKEQLWIQTHESANILWVFDYRRGIWTNFQFPSMPLYAAGVDNRVYVITEKSMYRLHDWFTHDMTTLNEKTEILAKVQTGTIFRGLQTLVKSVFASFYVVPDTRAELRVNGFKLPFSIALEPEYVFDDDDFISEDDDPLFPPGNTLTARRRCIVRGWNIVPEVEIVGGCCALNTAGLEIAEV